MSSTSQAAVTYNNMPSLQCPKKIAVVNPTASMNRFFSSSSTSGGVSHSGSTASSSVALMIVPFRYDSSSVFPKDGHRLDSSSLMLDSRVFNETPLSTKKCALTLIKLFYLLYHELPLIPPSLANQESNSLTMGDLEATEIFFAVSKVFQSRDQYLRRLAYLAIKELSKMNINVLIVISSLSQDVVSRVDPVYRANALKTLCSVTDSSLLQTIERFISQSLVDASPLLQSAALVSCYHLFNSPLNDGREMVRRWLSGDISSSGSMHGITKYHYYGLLFSLRFGDRMAIARLLKSLLSTNGANQGISNMPALALGVEAFTFLGGPTSVEINWKSLLTNSQEMIAYEAAKRILSLPQFLEASNQSSSNGKSNVSDYELRTMAIGVLQNFLASSRPLNRLCGLRTLSSLSNSRPDLVTTCNLDIEALVTDSNPSIATLAMTTLLKTGNETSVDRLLSSINTASFEGVEELKMSIVGAIGSLCLKFPSKAALLLTFLGDRLRDDGSLSYKKLIVNHIQEIGGQASISATVKRAALELLLDFIEDCEYPEIGSRICYYLSRNPGSDVLKVIRVLSNRLLLEGPHVRMASLGALIHLSGMSEKTKSTVVHIVKSHCLADEEEEIRHRAMLFLASCDENINYPELESMTRAWDDLELKLTSYLEELERATDLNQVVPLDLSDLPLYSVEEYLDALSHDRSKKRRHIAGPLSGPPASSMSSSRTSIKKVESLKDHLVQQSEQFLTYSVDWNEPLLTSPWIPLTEPETEYLVQSRKFIYGSHLLLQFHIRNTLPEHYFHHISVMINSSPLKNGLLLSTTLNELPPGSDHWSPLNVSDDTYNDSVYLLFSLENVPSVGHISSSVCFALVEDPADTDVQVEAYLLAHIPLSLADYLLPVWNSSVFHSPLATSVIPLSQISDANELWSTTDTWSFLKRVFHLPNNITSLNQALSALCNSMTGPASLLSPLTGFDASAVTGIAFLGGSIITASAIVPVLIRLRLAKPPTTQAIAVECILRSCSDELNEAIFQAL